MCSLCFSMLNVCNSSLTELNIELTLRVENGKAQTYGTFYLGMFDK